MDKKVTYSEQELVALLKARDLPSFSYLYTNYAGSLYHVVLRIIADRDIAQEVLQEAFVKIWLNVKKYDPAKGKLFTWMLCLTRNLAIDSIKSRTYRDNLRNCSLSGSIATDISSISLQGMADNIGLKEVVRKLAPKYRILIELAFFKGYTYQGIAESQCLPVGTVKSRIRTALQQLRAYFKAK